MTFFRYESGKMSERGFLKLSARKQFHFTPDLTVWLVETFFVYVLKACRDIFFMTMLSKVTRRKKISIEKVNI